MFDNTPATDNPEPMSRGIYDDVIRLAVAARWLGLCVTQNAHTPGNALVKWRLKRALYVEDHIADTISLGNLAAQAGLSRMYSAAQFRTATDLRPHEYVVRRRTHHAKVVLAENTYSLVEVALSVGFQAQAHLFTVFKRFAGETRRRWRVLYAFRSLYSLSRRDGHEIL
ncbi:MULTISPECIES: AraC family transcriptional regulator [Mesorhizobium]|uniref:helix-turn-helix transcriptional regulator n=1 Tax=Mesorhizobium TaxID=68287 RepID=UPI0013DF29FB|nr:MULTISPECIES: AraC family transcriptional regulator [Mesorhizobium]MCF6126257.1 AraC family transcriptional regulator [Mesorhizobium ciceri]MCQ8816269.1 AraC family transcriptional regulator [Mesorhizobium sp. SEMIA396]